MIYNLDNPLDRERFKKRVNHLYAKKAMVEVTDTSKRSLAANAYLHTILAYFGNEVGEPMQYVKEMYFKRICNPDIFVHTQTDRMTGEVTERLRSTRDIGKEQMSVAIDRFRNWASENGYYIPSADEHEYLKQMQYENERNRQWNAM